MGNIIEEKLSSYSLLAERPHQIVPLLDELIDSKVSGFRFGPISTRYQYRGK
jgi:hypothetical protein